MKGRSKYGVRTDADGKLDRTADGIQFDSKAECKRYKDLKLMEKAGIIENLELQPSYPVIWPSNGARLCTVKLDFRYVERGKVRIEDVKGVDTALSRLKRKMVEAAHGITVELIKRV